MTDLTTVVLTLAGPALTCAAALHLARRSERKNREEGLEKQREEMKGLLQTMVVDRIETAFHEISKLQRRATDQEGRHTYLLGLLVGKGCVDPKVCDQREGNRE